MVTLDTCFLHRDGCFPSAHRLPPSRASQTTNRFTQTTSSDVWRTLELDVPSNPTTHQRPPPPPTPRRPDNATDDLNASDLRLLLDPRPLVDPSAPASLLRHPALYCPPETLHSTVGNAGLVWMLGVVLHCMLTGSFPYVRASTWAAAMRAPADQAGPLLMVDIAQGAWTPHACTLLSPGAVKLLRGMLERDPGQRMALGAVLNDPWVAQGGPLGALRFNDSLVAMGRR